MPTAQSIRRPDAPQLYAAVIDNFRRAYAAKRNGTADALTDHEVLLAWEFGWMAPCSEMEDEDTLDEMANMLLEKPEPT